MNSASVNLIDANLFIFNTPAKFTLIFSIEPRVRIQAAFERSVLNHRPKRFCQFLNYYKIIS